MIVSWNWLKNYVDLSMTHDDLVDRLTMSGLNHEGTDVNGDGKFDAPSATGAVTAIDLEVTSNRADCLGHIGVAREIATLYDVPLKIPQPELKPGKENVSDVCAVEIQSPETCFRYTARVIRGVKIGPSPPWLQDRLADIGVASVNNVVDVTNYVMMECGQPLHAFDFSKIKNGKIIVRNAEDGEVFEAIDHKSYKLVAGMCVIADESNPVALGGVMGGADSEVSESTSDILLEAAYFDQLAVRNAARRLKLFSPSSFRFERNVDSANLEWASRRACQLIQELAGGEVLEGMVDVGNPPAKPESVTMRFAQLERLLGIAIPAEFAQKTLEQLGLEIQSVDAGSITALRPSWRKDLTREVDLIEEVGRIYGFDKIPDDVNVPMAASHRPTSDRLLERVRNVMTAAGYDEAMTPSLVPEIWSSAFSPWSDAEPMVSSQPMQGVLEEYSKNIGSVKYLRRSLLPSLIEARRINEYRNNSDASLFETATVYLTKGDNEIPVQPVKLGCVTGAGYVEVKGLIESVLAAVNPDLKVSVAPCDFELLDSNQSGELKLGDQTLGWIGAVSKQAAKKLSLRSPATVAEIDMAVLQSAMVAIPQHRQLSVFPAMNRDFNFVVDEAVRWAELESSVRDAAGDLLENVRYLETFRNEKKDGAGKKRILLSVVLRSATETLTGEQAEQVCSKIVSIANPSTAPSCLDSL